MKRDHIGGLGPHRLQPRERKLPRRGSKCVYIARMVRTEITASRVITERMTAAQSEYMIVSSIVYLLGCGTELFQHYRREGQIAIGRIVIGVRRLCLPSVAEGTSLNAEAQSLYQAGDLSLRRHLPLKNLLLHWDQVRRLRGWCH